MYSSKRDEGIQEADRRFLTDFLRRPADSRRWGGKGPTNPCYRVRKTDSRFTPVEARSRRRGRWGPANAPPLRHALGRRSPPDPLASCWRRRPRAFRPASALRTASSTWQKAAEDRPGMDLVAPVGVDDAEDGVNGEDRGEAPREEARS